MNKEEVEHERVEILNKLEILKYQALSACEKTGCKKQAVSRFVLRKNLENVSDIVEFTCKDHEYKQEKGVVIVEAKSLKDIDYEIDDLEDDYLRLKSQFEDLFILQW